ncbi:MAG TPA: GerMN domain-containing protein [Candidatus Eisenbacteria bacterium]|nr:GerMN domain-containing protein [Candidatus Eisenbacteria bacterium]
MRRVFVGLIVIAVLAWLAHSWTRRSGRAPRPEATVADSSAAGVKAMRLFFGAANGDSLVAESREMIEATGLHDRISGLVTELDRGPRARGVAVLPAGTSVLRVFLDDRGLMTLDLSGAFRQRFRGGASAEYLAVASLIRTIGANVPEARQVLIICAGRPVATLGGHLPLDRPLDVSDWP